MSLNYTILGKKIKSLRKKRHLSQDMLSYKIDKTVGYMSYIESGERHMSLETLVDLANALEVTPDYLLAEHLLVSPKTAEAEFNEILNGCSNYEKKIILDTVKELKRTLREARSIMRQR